MQSPIADPANSRHLGSRAITKTISGCANKHAGAASKYSRVNDRITIPAVPTILGHHISYVRQRLRNRGCPRLTEKIIHPAFAGARRGGEGRGISGRLWFLPSRQLVQSSPQPNPHAILRIAPSSSSTPVPANVRDVPHHQQSHPHHQPAPRHASAQSRVEQERSIDLSRLKRYQEAIKASNLEHTRRWQEPAGYVRLHNNYPPHKHRHQNYPQIDSEAPGGRSIPGAPSTRTSRTPQQLIDFREWVLCLMWAIGMGVIVECFFFVGLGSVVGSGRFGAAVLGL
jgi:hypothetical protein